MREHDLQPKRRRYVATSDGDHDGPIFSNLAKEVAPDGPSELWVADTTYAAITAGFVYLAAALFAWSRKVVGYAVSRSMDAQIAVALDQVALLPIHDLPHAEAHEAPRPPVHAPHGASLLRHVASRDRRRSPAAYVGGRLKELSIRRAPCGCRHA